MEKKAQENDPKKVRHHYTHLLLLSCHQTGITPIRLRSLKWLGGKDWTEIAFSPASGLNEFICDMYWVVCSWCSSSGNFNNLLQAKLKIRPQNLGFGLQMHHKTWGHEVLNVFLKSECCATSLPRALSLLFSVLIFVKILLSCHFWASIFPTSCMSSCDWSKNTVSRVITDDNKSVQNELYYHVTASFTKKGRVGLNCFLICKNFARMFARMMWIDCIQIYSNSWSTTSTVDILLVSSCAGNKGDLRMSHRIRGGKEKWGGMPDGNE